MSSFRMERINKELAREIAYLLEFAIKDDAVKNAVITSVNCSRDLKHAKVWFTTLTEEVRPSTFEALTSASRQLRKLMGERMYLRTTPELEFCIDTSQEYGRRIDSLLESLAVKTEEAGNSSDLYEIDYSGMESILNAHEDWRLLSHVKPDGDTLGAASALYAAGIDRGKRVSWMGESEIPLSYKFLPCIDNYVKSDWIDLDDFKGDEPLFICVDTSKLERTVGGLHDQWKILNIDHHADNSRFGTYNLIETGASSVCEIIWNFMKAQSWNITKEIAIGLYTGIATDTGNFSFNNTKENAHYAAADLLKKGIDPNFINLAVRGNRSLEGIHLWGKAMTKMRLIGKSKQICFTYLTLDDFRSTYASQFETEFLVNQMLLIHGVEAAALIVEDVQQVRVSLRSISGSVSASKIAKKIGGGGHELASGAVCKMSIYEAIPLVLNAIEEVYAERDTALK